MLVELQTSEANLPRDLTVEYVGQTSDGYDAAIISGVWTAAETHNGGVALELVEGSTYHIDEATILKSGDAEGALDIPGAELAPTGTVTADSNQHKALCALREHQQETGRAYATPADAARHTDLDASAVRNAFGVLFGIKSLLTRKPAGTGTGGVRFAFALTPAAERELDAIPAR